jgi:hypothetical protein
MSRERIIKELTLLQEGQQLTELITNGRDYVIYRQVPTAGSRLSLPPSTDVIVPVPNGYPGAPIDLAGLPVGSPFLPRVKGGQNNQGIIQAAGISWQLASYHPHQNGGGGPWDQMRHGFHTYFDHLLSWLERLN